MRKIILLMMVILLCGCDWDVDSKTPRELNKAKRPVRIVALNGEGLIVTDANGKLYSYPESFYFVQTLMESGMKVGDVLMDGPHQCPPPTRLNIQRHWQEAHGYGEIQNTLDSKMLDRCSMECQPEYWETME